LELKNKKAGL